ncbi:GNAT family N-acetyltransferase [Bacillus shivajii]|uniref:GNAT family N-acetyltransferase n=1 Tax=Bacillus shivajii TaxID=1983719 RepID=UPI001CFBFF9C|nr:GNAT family N-acetyltransferase [Bacillus shivajii]UCZ53810.1 GNAT family N-acetyltransferase [Bacillus shivajii]
MKVRRLLKGEEAPYDLLLLADPSKKIVDRYLERGFCYVSEIEDEIIGVFVLLFTKGDTIEIVNVAISEKYQGMGLGKQLVFQAMEEAKNLKGKTVEIGTGNSSISQLALYQKCGFRIVDIEKDFFLKHYDEKIVENGIQCMDMIRLRREI